MFSTCRAIYVDNNFLIYFLLGTKTAHKRPIVKILKVEDLKNDDIVERIKRELGQQLSFKLDPTATKLLYSSDFTKKSVDSMMCTAVSTTISSTLISTDQAKTTIANTKFSTENEPKTAETVKTSTLLIKSPNQDIGKDQSFKKIKVDPDSKDTMKPPDKSSSYIVLNRKVHLERMKRFISMSKSDIPAKTERKFKCEAPLSELKTPVDTIRCSKCGVLYESDILVAHLKNCQGDKRKTKYGCRLCSFTDCDYKQLESHIRNDHPKRTK